MSEEHRSVEGGIRAAGASPLLDYAVPRPIELPFRDIVYSSFFFGAAHWLADCVVTYVVVVACSQYSQSPGLADYQHGERLGRFAIDEMVESVVTVVIMLVLVGVQLVTWRVQPIEYPRRIWPVAWIGGLMFCGARWGVYLVAERLTGTDSVAMHLVPALLLVVAGGALMGWRRVAGRG